MYIPNGRNHVRAPFIMWHKHVPVLGCRTFVYTHCLWPSPRVGIPSGRAVSVHTPSPSVAIASDRPQSSVPVSERPQL